MSAASKTYVALLRGVNVGGHRVVKMERLRALFDELGFENVRTYIQSGNVFFDAKRTTVSALQKTIDAHLESALGFDVVSFVRERAELEALIARNPYAGVPAEDDTRFLVMFLSRPLPKVELPMRSPKGDVELIGQTPGEALLVLRQRPGRPVDPTPFLNKISPQAVTGRFFHTLAKMLESTREATATDEVAKRTGRKRNSG